MITTKERNLLEPIGFFVVSLIFFTWGLGHQEIIGFESRFYLFALEMWRSGFSWFPTTYHHPYPDYPVTLTFLIYSLAKLFGGLNKFVAVLPTAIAAALTVTVTYLIGRLYKRRWGFCAVLFLLLTVTFLKNARSISLDMFPAMAATFCFYLVHSADILVKKKRVIWIYLFFIIGFAFRGPIGLIIPTGVVCIYYLIDRNFKQFIVTGLIAVFLLLILTSGLLSIAHHVGGRIFMYDVLRMEIFGRIDNAYLPFYFYFVHSLTSYALSFPIALLVLIGVIDYQREKRSFSPEVKLLIKLVAWTLVILIGMSIPGDKKTRYIISIAPAVSLIAAYLFVAPPKEKFFTIFRDILDKIFLYFPAILMLGTEVIFYYGKNNKLMFDIQYWTVAITLVTLQLFNFLLAFRYLNRPKLLELMMLFMAAFSFIYTYIYVIEPMEIYLDKAHDFVTAVEQQRAKSHARLVFYKEKPDGLPIKYLLNADFEIQPLFIDNQDDLLKFSEPSFFVTSMPYFLQLPEKIKSRFKIVATDTMGHTKVIVFTNQ